MKIVTPLLCLLFFIASINCFSQDSQLKDLPSNCIEPSGWAKEFLNRQERGLTGHPEQSGFPFNTKMWTENMNYKDREFEGGTGWWPFEQTGYYLDGALRCGYMNKSDKLKQRALENINYVLAHADKDGTLHAGTVKDDWWPLVVFMRMLFEEYENTKDAKLLQAIQSHYQATYKKEESFNVPKDASFEARSILHVEHLAALYEITSNKWYLQIAEKLYTKFETNLFGASNQANMLTAMGMAQGLQPQGHAVTYHEFLKLPAILYYHTKKEKYKKAIYEAYKQLEEHHELVDGLSSGVEHFEGNNSNMAHELCNVTDFNWAAGWALLATGDARFADKMEKVIYNAGFSGVTSDFKAHQYYSLPNMVISSDMSSIYNDDTNWGFNGKGRLCYRPGHDTECCTGNVHRMFPTFLNRACLVGDREVKVAFYVPGTFTIPVGKEIFSFTQVTNYPFEHSVLLEVNKALKKKIKLGLRIPNWTDSYVININGKEVNRGIEESFFKDIHRKFKKGDKIEITFNTTPKIDNKKGIALNYGPLVFSYPLAARTRTITEDSGNKCSPDFPAYQLFPEQHLNWAFALPQDIKERDIKVLVEKNGKYPWDYGMSPIKLKVEARSVSNWKFFNHTSTAAIPTKVELKNEPAQTLTLEPMGATLLRITEFPLAKF